MEKRIRLDELRFSNQDFWQYYFCVNYPNGYDEELDLAVSDILSQEKPANIDWINEFTQYDEARFLANDGYEEEPTTLETKLRDGECIKIEFHPGDTLFFINDQEIGCTGPHWKLQAIPYGKLESILEQENGEILFFLLLPMALVSAEEAEKVQETLKARLRVLFPSEISDVLSKCLVSGLKEA